MVENKTKSFFTGRKHGKSIVFKDSGYYELSLRVYAPGRNTSRNAMILSIAKIETSYIVYIHFT